jgi:hypothetical protein
MKSLTSTLLLFVLVAGTASSKPTFQQTAQGKQSLAQGHSSPLIDLDSPKLSRCCFGGGNIFGKYEKHSYQNGDLGLAQLGDGEYEEYDDGQPCCVDENNLGPIQGCMPALVPLYGDERSVGCGSMTLSTFVGVKI